MENISSERVLTDSLIINLYGGPGCGKSTVMAGVFSELKWLGINCEMGPEFAKEKVWEESFKVLGNQIYVFGKQLHTLVRVCGKVDVVITDSPLLLSLIYGKNEIKEFHDLVLAVHKKYRTMNLFLRRHKAYNPAGRMQNEEEAKEKDKEILDMLHSNNISYEEIDAGRESIRVITRKVLESLVATDRYGFRECELKIEVT